ncbi:MAG: class I SAM-dependent methyltransferase [Acidobacteriia bacterium]|nr:class I SAM-dependent methyltransferase [Terriglobia bacterium]
MKERIHQEPKVTGAVTAYDALAPFYKSISAARSPYLEAVEKIIATGVRGAGSLLDIGAGDATRTCIIAETAGIQNVVAVEPSAAMRARCEKKVHFWECRAEEIPETDLKFDVIVCLWNVLGHIQTTEERLLTLAKAKRLLSPNGVMFVDVNHRYNAVVHGWSRTLWHMLRDYFFWSDTNGDVIVSWKIGSRPVCTHGHLFTQKELKILFQSAGFVIKGEWVLNYRTGTVCKSPLRGSLLYRLEAAQDEAYVPAPSVVWGNAALTFRKR